MTVIDNGSWTGMPIKIDIVHSVFNGMVDRQQNKKHTNQNKQPLVYAVYAMNVNCFVVKDLLLILWSKISLARKSCDYSRIPISTINFYCIIRRISPIHTVQKPSSQIGCRIACARPINVSTCFVFIAKYQHINPTTDSRLQVTAACYLDSSKQSARSVQSQRIIHVLFRYFQGEIWKKKPKLQ